MSALLQDEWLDSVALTARELRRGSAALFAEVSTLVVDNIPELASTPELRLGLDDSVRGNIDTVLQMYETGLDPRVVKLSRPQLDFARTISRRGVPLSSILEAYRFGQSIFIGTWGSHLASRIESSRTLASVVAHSTSTLDQYFKRAAHEVVALYGAEHDRWGRSRESEMQTLLEFLRSSAGTSDPAELNGYGLHGSHLGLALVPRTGSADLSAAATQSTVSALAIALSAQAAYLIPAGASCAWAWLRNPRVMSRAELRVAAEAAIDDDLTVCFGRRERDASGFRSTHRQALRLSNAVRRTTGEAALWYDELEIPVMVMGDGRASAEEFIHSELGALAADGHSAAVLRETLRIYLEERSNARRAAERLFLHRNSVVYRVKSAEALLGRPVTVRQLELQIALHLIDSPIVG